MWMLAIVISAVVAIALSFAGWPWRAWVVGWTPLLARWAAAGGGWGLAIAIAVWLGVAFVTGGPPIRPRALSAAALRWLSARGAPPSDTQPIAVEGGAGGGGAGRVS